MGLISSKLLAPRPQQLGRIKIGRLGDTVKGKAGKADWRKPVKIDHFIVTTNERGADGNFVRDDRIHGLIGEQPTELEGFLMYETPEENFHSEMVQYRGRGKDGKVWSCDGETAHNLKKGSTGECLRLSGKKCKCKPYARLHLQLLHGHTMGYHFFRTTSWESVANIQTFLQDIYKRFGTCYQVPVRMTVYPAEDRHDKGVSTSYKVALTLSVTMAEAAQQIAQHREYLKLARGEIKALAAGTQEELGATDGDDADEFFPPGTDEEARAGAIEDALVVEEDEEDDVPEPEPVENDPPDLGDDDPFADDEEGDDDEDAPAGQLEL